MSQESDMCHDFRITCYSQGWMMSRWFLCAQTTCTEQWGPGIMQQGGCIVWRGWFRSRACWNRAWNDSYMVLKTLDI